MKFLRFKRFFNDIIYNFSRNIVYLVEFRFLKKSWQRNLLTFIHVIVFIFIAF
jgi:hypothetical protein